MGLVHRDVKPANVLIVEGAGADDAPHVYLSDFGIAKQQASNVTRTGMFIGTAEYASPEQIEGKELDRRSDVYSLGCVLYECLTGNPAYEKDSEVALIYAHLLEPPPSIQAARPELAARSTPCWPRRWRRSRTTVTRARESCQPPCGKPCPQPAAEPSRVPAAQVASPAMTATPPATVASLVAEPLTVAPAARPRLAAPAPPPR